MPEQARFGIVFGAVGAARDALDTAIEYAQTREVFDRSLASFQLKDSGQIDPDRISLGKLNNVRRRLTRS